MRIGWDLDGVEHAFERGYFDAIHALGLAEKFPCLEVFPDYAVTEWNWFYKFGMTLEDFLDVANRGADHGIIFTGYRIGNGRDLMKKLRAAGHTIHIVTDRSFGSTPDVSKKLTTNFLEHYGYEYDSLTFSRDKTVVPTDYFIDDKLENYDALDKVGTKVYLLNRKWNEQNDTRRRVDSVEEFANLFDIS